jgi:hypothetical protein
VWIPAAQIARIEIVRAATTGAEMAPNPGGTIQQ